MTLFDGLFNPRPLFFLPAMFKGSQRPSPNVEASTKGACLDNETLGGTAAEILKDEKTRQRIEANRLIHLQTVKDVTTSMRLVILDKTYEFIPTSEDRRVLLRTFRAVFALADDLNTSPALRSQGNLSPEGQGLHKSHAPIDNFFESPEVARALLCKLIVQAAHNTVFIQGNAAPIGTLQGVCEGILTERDQASHQTLENYIFGKDQEYPIQHPEQQRELGLSVYVLRIALRLSPRLPELLDDVTQALLQARIELRGGDADGLKVGPGINYLLILELPRYLFHNPNRAPDVERLLRTIGVAERHIPQFMNDLRKSAGKLPGAPDQG